MMIDEPTYIRETLNHIDLVGKWLHRCEVNLRRRSRAHDKSKLREPEKSGFLAMGGDRRLKEMTYGSDEYRSVLREYLPTIHEHYRNNDHHVESHAFTNADGSLNKDEAANGTAISRMSLLSLLEMTCDWYAAGQRTSNGDIVKSIEINQQRFGYSDELKSILVNTARELEMIGDE